MGTILHWHLLNQSGKEDCHWVTLEVWEGNQPAVSLYKKFGFIPAGFRSNYYDQKHDALIMWAGSLQNKYFRERMEKTKADRIKQEIFLLGTVLKGGRRNGRKRASSFENGRTTEKEC